jgi:hypothetical protein
MAWAALLRSGRAAAVDRFCVRKGIPQMPTYLYIWEYLLLSNAFTRTHLIQSPFFDQKRRN